MKITFDKISHRSGTNTAFQLADFGGKNLLAPQQPCGDCESRVMEAHVAGCIHATVSFSCQLAQPFYLASERASISCRCEASSLPTARDSARRDAPRWHSKVSHPGNNYKLTRHVSHLRGARCRWQQRVRPALEQASVLIVELGKAHGD